MKKLKEYIDESLIKSYDTDKLISKIKSKYKDIEVSLHPSKSNETLFSITFKNKDDFENFTEDFYILHLLDFFGYYITAKVNKNLLIGIEPNFGTKCTDFIYNECNGLIFHVTSKNLYEKYIKYKGLKPVEGKTYRLFPERIFFSCGESVEEIIDNINFLKDQLKIYDPIVLMIDLKKNHYNVNFYYDTSEDDWHNFIYCNAYFPYKYITRFYSIEDIKLNIKENLTINYKLPFVRTVTNSKDRFEILR